MHFGFNVKNFFSFGCMFFIEKSGSITEDVHVQDSYHSPPRGFTKSTHRCRNKVRLG